MKRTNPWNELERLAQGPHAAELVPIVGSGFVTQAVLEGSKLPGAPKRPRAVSWYSLLESVAQEFACELARSNIGKSVPGQTTLLWDAMVSELTQRAPRKLSAHVWETRLRRAIARCLREDTATLELSRSFVDSFLRLGWNDVLTLNFDRVLLSRGIRPNHRASGAAKRASLGADLGNTRVWFPHGHQNDPPSIVLGAHAYGVRIAAMQAAFESHAKKPAPRPTHGLDTWVGVALERPLLFMGLSLTREEWTVWWLLTQRARFLSRRPKKRRPPVFVFVRRPAVHESLEAYGGFQTLSRACELLDLRLLWFEEYGPGWKKLRKAIGWPP